MAVHTLHQRLEVAPVCPDCAVDMVRVGDFGWICAATRMVDGRARVCGNTQGDIAPVPYSGRF